MSEFRNMLGEKNNGGSEFGDTTYTKIFVGGLAWETKSDSLERYFQPFGEILEAVVITDKISGRSKGYGFVTFKDPESARKAIQTPFPMIDGRRANCNLAFLGAQKNRGNQTDLRHGVEKLQSWPRSSPVFRQVIPTQGFTYPASAYGYTAGYPLQDIYAMNYYGVYGQGGNQIPTSYNTGATGSPGIYYNYYPFYPQQQGQTQYPKLLQYPSWPQQYRALGVFPASISSPLPPSAGGAVAVPAPASVAGSSPQQNSAA